MKPGPVIAMVVLILLGMWLVLQPALARGQADLDIKIGAMEIMLQRDQVDGVAGYRITAPASMAEHTGFIPATQLDEFVRVQIDAWNARPVLTRHLLGFFNITGWGTFWWITIGLVGQAAFFGRMFVQWIISERSQISTVPEIFWWFSFIGGVCLFIYFVWRKDIVGVTGQSTGVVIYARNLRLIHKEKRRVQGESCTSPKSA